jgi:TolB-like protein
MIRISSRLVVRLVESLALCALARPALSQCPDGTPPPCGQAFAPARAAPPPAAERGRRFLVLPFRNLSRAPQQEWLVEGSTTMLAEALGRWQEIRVVPDERLYPALRRAGLVPGSVVDLSRVRRIAEETDGWTAVTGEVLATGGRLRVTARAFDVVTNRELVRSSAQEVPADGDVRVAFDRIAASLLPAAGLQAAPADVAPPTHSLDAYRAYLRGVGYLHRSRYRQARDAFLESVRLDSGFASAYRLLAQTTLFMNPFALLASQNPAQRYAARAAELAAQLPASQRNVALAVNAMFEGQITAARSVLEQEVAADSSNVSAVGLLSLLEWGDPILVRTAGGERPRGSLNRSNRLTKRVLALNPEDHAAYLPLTLSHAYAGGDLPGFVLGVRSEGASFRDLLIGGAPRVFVTVYRADTIALVPAESLSVLVPPDSLAAARRQSLAVARAWSDRWLSVGADEGEAHLMASRVAHRQGELARALAELDTAQAMGVESGLSAPAFARVTILAKLGHRDAARAQADSLLAAGGFDSVPPLPTEWTEAEAWAFNLWLLRGDLARPEALLDRLAASLRSWGIMKDSALASAFALPLVAGAAVRPFWLLELPPSLRAEALDSAWARRESAPGSRIVRAIPALGRLVLAASASDSALAMRVRAAPWYQP